MNFSNIFDKFGRMITGLSFPLISFLHFLYKAVIYTCLRIDCQQLYGIVKAIKEKTTENIGVLFSYLHLPLKSIFQYVFDQPS